jgi:hypothetical protein
MNDINFRQMPAKDLVIALTACDITEDQIIEITDSLIGLGERAGNQGSDGYWAPEKKLESIKKVLLVSDNLPSYTIAKLVEECVSDSNIYSKRMNIMSELFLKQRYISGLVLVRLMHWVAPWLNDFYPSDYKNYEQPDKTFSHIVKHASFPIEELTQLCLHPNSNVRRIASVAPACPEEARVTACLLDMSSLSSEATSR